MKKAVKCILICLVLGLCAALSGCINLQAEQYETSEGITMQLFSDGEDYYAQIMVVSSNLKGTVGEVDNYLFKLLSTQFETEKDEYYPPYDVYTSEGSATEFTYICKMNNSSWHRGDVPVEYGFLTAKVFIDLENPFADAYKSGTELNNIYNLMLNGGEGIEPFSRYFGDLDIDEINTKMLISGRSSLSAGTPEGKIVYDGGVYYYQMENKLLGTAEHNLSNRLVFTYKAMVSYGWFTIALILGLAAVGAILLFAKKKDGKKIDLTNRGPFVSNKDDFGAYGGASTPFEGFGGTGSNSNSPSDDSKKGKGGSPFDGF